LQSATGGNCDFVLSGCVHKGGVCMPVLRIEGESDPGLLLCFDRSAESCQRFRPKTGNRRSLPIVSGKTEGAWRKVSAVEGPARFHQLSEESARIR